jgi:hypothetical protein
MPAKMPRRACLLVLVLIGAAAHAEPADPIEPLRRRLDELGRIGAELPAALDALHSVENRLGAIATEVDRLAAARAADPEVRRVIDELRAQVADLERRLSLAQAQLGDAAPAARVGYDEGLFVQTAPVVVRLNAAAQPRYRGLWRTDGAHDTSDFELHHAQLALMVNVLRIVDLAALFDFGAEYIGGPLAPVRDLYLEVRPLPWLSLRAGQFRVPFSRQRQKSELLLTFTDRTMATRAFTWDRDLGGLVEVRLFGDRLRAQLAVTDGVEAGAAVHNDNLDLAYTARLVAQPFGQLGSGEGDRARSRALRFAVGASFRYDLPPTDLPSSLRDLNHDGVVDNVEVLSAGADAALTWRGFAVEGEYFYRHERPGFGLREREYHGGYAQASAMVWRGLELGARFSYAQPPQLGAPQIGLSGLPSDAIEAGGVVNYYFWDEHVKLQVGYDYRREEPSELIGPRLLTGHVFDVQAQAGF